MCDTLIWKRCISAYIEFYTYQYWQENYYFNLQTFRTFVRVEINKVLHDSVVEGCHLVAGFKKSLAGGSRIERVGRTKFLRKSAIFFANSRNFFHMFLRPHCTFETKKATTGTPSKMVLFQKTWWKRVKEYSFSIFTDRAIVEDCIAVILPHQLTI